MGNGLLAHWRRRIVARGLAGAILFAVPVGVAAAIGFGTSLSGVAGGLSAIAEGPDELSPSTATTPAKLNRAVAALASRGAANRTPASENRVDGSSGGSDVVVGTDESGSTGGAGSDGSGGADATPTITPPSIGLPGGGGGGASGGADGGVDSTVGGVEDTVNGVVDGVGNTVNGLLGGG